MGICAEMVYDGNAITVLVDELEISLVSMTLVQELNRSLSRLTRSNRK